MDDEWPDFSVLATRAEGAGRAWFAEDTMGQGLLEEVAEALRHAARLLREQAQRERKLRDLKEWADNIGFPSVWTDAVQKRITDVLDGEQENQG